MKRKRRTRILVEGDPALRRQLAEEINAAHETVELEQPENGLIMITLRETARRSMFHLGEVMATECRVEVNGVIGLGIIAGDDPEAARDLAIIDGAYNAGLPECASWLELLEAEERRLAQVRVAEETRLLETRVRFETMDAD